MLAKMEPLRGMKNEMKISPVKKSQYEFDTQKNILSKVNIIKVAICDKVQGASLTAKQIQKIRTKLMNAIDDKAVGKIAPKFYNTSFGPGAIWMDCADEETVVWLLSTVSTLKNIWGGANLGVFHTENLPRTPAVEVIISENKVEISTFLSKIEYQNQGLNTKHWYGVCQKTNSKDLKFKFFIDKNSFHFLKKRGFKVFWMFGVIHFKSISDALPMPGKEK